MKLSSFSRAKFRSAAVFFGLIAYLLLTAITSPPAVGCLIGDEYTSGRRTLAFTGLALLAAAFIWFIRTVAFTKKGVSRWLIVALLPTIWLCLSFFLLPILLSKEDREKTAVPLPQLQVLLCGNRELPFSDGGASD
jgi:hypothetical protein